jgi:NAD(P)-dependent dehydrogenase (short-subunit alcohol dehydrogenase family)
MAIAAARDHGKPGGASSLEGKVAIVTGATGGLGFETAFGLARQGATTILAGRDLAKGVRALMRIRQTMPAASIHFEPLDLASLASITGFAASVSAAHCGVVDILVNNAGVMALPRRLVTEDGFERQIGVNYLGHFALTAQLKDALCRSSGGGRVVSVASLAHRRAVLDLSDLQSERAYQPMAVYGRSKLAMLVFALELQRRALRNGWNLRSVAAHPGWARTDIIGNGMGGGTPGLRERLIAGVFGMLAQSARDGARPLIYAAASPQAEGGAYYGPTHLGERRGAPSRSWIAPQATDPVLGSQLWAMSEKLTGVSFG